jgi:two-component system nitrate/nitrite response regulator NarL
MLDSGFGDLTDWLRPVQTVTMIHRGLRASATMKFAKAFLHLRNAAEVQTFLRGVLSPDEVRHAEHRWEAIQLLLEGRSQREVGKAVNLSIATVSKAAQSVRTNREIFKQVLSKEKPNVRTNLADAGRNMPAAPAAFGDVLAPTSLPPQLSQDSGAIRVAVIDNHPMFREGTVQALTLMDDIEVVGEGATAADALKVAEELRPDVMLLDVRLPGDGVQAVANIARVYPSVRTVMLTASENEMDVASALHAGARGYVLKGSSGGEIAETVRTIFNGESYVAPRLAAQLLIERAKLTELVASPTNDLTAREDEIFMLVSSGMTNKEIANRLHCTERTIKHHMTSIMRKLNVRNRIEAMLMSRRKADG